MSENKKVLYCDLCSQKFSSKYKLKIHMTRNHIRYCSTCKEFFGNKSYSGHVRSFKHKQKLEVKLSDNIFILKEAFDGKVINYRVKNISDEIIVADFLEKNSGNVRKVIESAVSIQLLL